MGTLKGGGRAIAVVALLAVAKPTVALESLEPWIERQAQVSSARLLANVSPAGARPGVVVASPERWAPPYFYHWVRDAALTMDTVIHLYDRAASSERLRLKERLREFVNFSQDNQQAQALGGLGEPKFHVDGRPYSGAWCRPQNDGPALRAVTLIRWARRLMKEGEGAYVREVLFDGLWPTRSVIKTDLEFVAHHWRDPNCDLWEEISGDHLYTRAVQWRALKDGAELALDLGDRGASRFYEEQARALEFELDLHWDPSRGVFIPTRHRVGGIDYKASGLDAAVILALLHADRADGFFNFIDARWLSTFERLIEAFQKLYPINQRADLPGVAIGRYPEDLYAGNHFNGGNPWVLLTAAFARYAYGVAAALWREGRAAEAQRYFLKGESFMERVRVHANPDGSLSEQMDRDTGFMMSAPDLTWSHSEVLQAFWAREALPQALRMRVRRH